ncbi:hypothetical protein, partial [Kitasatospora sp. NPDC093558]|uniref:Tc toxin subunit A-related protein n=1 Tax=Kitasatospora sp. NPDC093558 TaxID=3155201 RepID=UPI00344437FB
AQNDGGLFETNLRDERYLPFENSGVDSQWQLELPANPMNGDPAQFDYNTISDVILHLRYTARPGGTALRSGALAELRRLINEASAAGSVRLLSVRHEFPDVWAKFTSAPASTTQRYQLSIPLSPELYPYWGRGGLHKVHTMEVLALPAPGAPAGQQDKVFSGPLRTDVTVAATLTRDPDLGTVTRGNWGAGLPASPSSGSIELYFDGNQFDEQWIAITWGA